MGGMTFLLCDHLLWLNVSTEFVEAAIFNFNICLKPRLLQFTETVAIKTIRFIKIKYIENLTEVVNLKKFEALQLFPQLNLI